MPIQRIPRYKLLLHRLLKLSHDERSHDVDSDHALSNAVEKVSAAATLINETIRRHEYRMDPLLFNHSPDFAIFMSSPNRFFIRNGKLVKVSRKRPEAIVLHLFNDLLVYSDVLLTGALRTRRSIPLSSSHQLVQVRHMSPDMSSYCLRFQHGYGQTPLALECGFVITSTEKSFMLFATSVEERNSWVESIQEAIQKTSASSEMMVRNHNSNPSHTVATATNAMPLTSMKIIGTLNQEEALFEHAALWVPDIVAETCSICQAGFTLLFRRHHCRYVSDFSKP